MLLIRHALSTDEDSNMLEIRVEDPETGATSWTPPVDVQALMLGMPPRQQEIMRQLLGHLLSGYARILASMALSPSEVLQPTVADLSGIMKGFQDRLLSRLQAAKRKR